MSFEPVWNEDGYYYDWLRVARNVLRGIMVSILFGIAAIGLIAFGAGLYGACNPAPDRYSTESEYVATMIGLYLVGSSVGVVAAVAAVFVGWGTRGLKRVWAWLVGVLAPWVVGALAVVGAICIATQVFG